MGKGFWHNAFTVEPDKPMSPEDRAWLESIAQALIKRRLRDPAVLFLETTKPLHFMAGQGVRFLDPVFSLVVPEEKLKQLREKLLSARASRVRPGWDDKVLADWNGMMIAALARAAAVFQKPEWMDRAERAFFFIDHCLENAPGIGSAPG